MNRTHSDSIGDQLYAELLLSLTQCPNVELHSSNLDFSRMGLRTFHSFTTRIYCFLQASEIWFWWVFAPCTRLLGIFAVPPTHLRLKLNRSLKLSLVHLANLNSQLMDVDMEETIGGTTNLRVVFSFSLAVRIGFQIATMNQVFTIHSLCMVDCE